jgi:PPOX class probable F420-dependent enzyme
MLGTPEQDAFVSSQKWAAVTTLRSDGSPTTSVVFFAREGDTLFFSTTADRLKAKTLRRDPRITICVLDEGPPYRFVTIEGVGEIEADDIVPGHVAVNRVMRGDPGWEPPEGFEERLRRDRRVIVRVTAQRVSGVVNRG